MLINKKMIFINVILRITIVLASRLRITMLDDFCKMQILHKLEKDDI